MSIFKQWREVLAETKTQTRRANFIYNVGSIQAVVPQYLHPSVWWHPVTGEKVQNPRVHLANSIDQYEPISHFNEHMRELGFKQGKVLIVDKRTEPVQDITEEDAIAEGILLHPNGGYYCEVPGHYITANTARGCYSALWDSINTAKKWRWDSNPVIVAVTFALVK